MRSDEAAVAIIGGGFSGTMAAAQLARRGLSAFLVDGSGRMGRGIAFATDEPAHVLNVRAEVMSAWPEDLADFARAVEAEGGSAKDFVERRRFGAYLDTILDEAVASGLVTPVETMAVAANRDAGGWAVSLDDGRSLRARALVLANGNQRPAPFAEAEGLPPGRYFNDPWGAEAKAAVARLAAGGGSVLLIGTGLTAVDLALSLDAAGHAGTITALSRRGQIPRGHIPFEPAPVERSDVPMGNVLALWRWLRRRGAEVGWRAAVDALRPHSHAIWQSFGAEDRQRFLRHARPWWDAHRHRIATDVAVRLKDLVGEGRLEVAAGRLKAMRAAGEAIEVDIARRGSGRVETRRFAAIFNCTGPLADISGTDNPILQQMLGDGLVAPGELGMGIRVDEHDRAGDRIWAIGPMTKGRYWEIIAVPDIRGQAAAIAAGIEAELAHVMQP